MPGKVGSGLRSGLGSGHAPGNEEKAKIRMSDYITTYTGLHFVPIDPDPALIDIRDIAHSLPLICRGNGQVKTFFSVGQHCINCAKEAEARGFSKRIILAALVHDACECYLSDVPRPFKKSIPAYREAEHRLLDIIYERFLGSVLTEEEEKTIKSIDDDMLYYDLAVLLDEKQERDAPQLRITLDYTVKPFAEVEHEYLEIFERVSCL